MVKLNIRIPHEQVKTFDTVLTANPGAIMDSQEA